MPSTFHRLIIFIADLSVTIMQLTKVIDTDGPTSRTTAGLKSLDIIRQRTKQIIIENEQLSSFQYSVLMTHLQSTCLLLDTYVNDYCT